MDVINSDIIAQKDEMDANTGNILFKAQAVNITSQNATTTNTHSFAQKTTGLTASVSSSLVGDVQSIETLKDAINDTNSRRAKLMGGLAAASKARTLNQNLQDGKLGSIRAQATIGSQSTKSDSHSYQETNDAANVHTDGNLIFDIKGKGENSTLTVTGSNISVGNNLYQNVEGDVTYQASTQTSTSDSRNSSKGWGAGIYASANLGTDGLSSNSAGLTANANRAKGSSQETTITHTNTQVTVGGTTVNDIGGNLILDGANLDTTYLTGTVDGDLIVKSRQDSYQYTHDQKQAGGSLDVSFQGVPQSASINGGKTDIDASYKQVTHQSGITAKESTLSVQGQGSFTGGYLITDAGKNQTQFAQGIQTQDIQNHLNYEGDAISIGIGIGADTSSPDGKAKPALQGIGYGTITPTHKTSTTHSAITDQAGLSHINTENFNRQEVQDELNPIIANSFNQEQVLKELNAQTIITTEFGREAPKQIGDYAQNKELELLAQGNIEEAKKWSEDGIYRTALHTAAGLLATGTIEGAASAGTTAYAIPKIDEYLKEQGFDESTRQTTLLALSATLGATIGDSTASTVNNVGQVQWNYLTHIQHAQRREELSKCRSVACVRSVTRKWENKSEEQSAAFDGAYENCRDNAKCDDFHNLHVVEREKLTQMGIDEFRKDVANGNLDKNWNPKPDFQNAFHNFNEHGTAVTKKTNGLYNNVKYVHKNGQFEVIVSREKDNNGNFIYITRPNSRPTYNYGISISEHYKYDMNPWADFGSGYRDNTTYGSRRVQISGKYLGEFHTHQINERIDAIREFERIDRQKSNKK